MQASIRSGAPPPLGESDDPRAARLWQAVDELVDRAVDLDGLRAHRLHLFAARRWRTLGLPVPAALAEEERSSAVTALTVPVVLERLRAACAGPLVLMKGPELAASYPDAALRPYRDVDILTPDPEAVQRSLVSAGFVPIGYPDGYYAHRHHLRPLQLPSLPLVIEIHRRPEWMSWSSPPPVEELVATAVPSSVGVEGFLGLAPSRHALVVAAHSWAGMPLRRVLDLVDVASLAARSDTSEIAAVAEQWGVAGLWELFASAIEALFYRAQMPSSLRIWARNLASVRDATVAESHQRRILSPFWVLPGHRAAAVTVGQLVRALTPLADESWRKKLSRTGRAVRHAFGPLGRHGG